MATKEELQAKYNSLMVTINDLAGQITVLDTLRHDNLVCRDEIQRQIDVIDNGEKRIEPKTLEVVTAEIAAAKPVVIKEEPIKEVVVTP